MEGSVRASNGDIGTIEIRTGQNRIVRRLRSKDRQDRFRKGFLSGDHGSAFQERGLDCHRDDHRSAGTQIPVQCSRHGGKFKLDAANAKKCRTASLQPKRGSTNAVDSRPTREERQDLAIDLTDGSRFPWCDLRNYMMRFLKRFAQGELRLNRTDAFSDGVFAIVVTLLVLELKVPILHDRASVRELDHRLVDLVPKFLSWLISFVIVCKFWLNHHHLLTFARHATYGMVCLNSIFLMGQAFIPFPTALMGEFPT